MSCSALCAVLMGMYKFSGYQPFYRKEISPKKHFINCEKLSGFFCSVGSFHVASSLTWDKLESLVMVCSLSLCWFKSTDETIRRRMLFLFVFPLAHKSHDNEFSLLDVQYLGYSRNPCTITKVWLFAVSFSVCFSKCCDAMHYSDCVIISFDSSGKLSTYF